MRKPKISRNWLKDDDGSMSVEFAMIGLGFILLIIGIIEFGRLAWTNNVIGYAIDEAARYAVLHQDATESEIELYAQDMLRSYHVSPSKLDITVSNVQSSSVDFIEITGSYHFESVASALLPASVSEVDLDITSRRPIYVYD
jgi:Flp pilus assembly protein TadG